MNVLRCALLVALPAVAAWTLLADEGSAAEGQPAASAGGKLWVYVGTYTRGPSKGIYWCELDLAAGKLGEPVLAGEATNPSFLAIHPKRPLLYAVGELAGFGGGKGGAVSAFAIEPTGKLKLLNQQSSGGPGPCHVSVDGTGKAALVANYSGGSVACLPIKDDGSLAEAASFIQHEGSSVNPQRQKGPHAHSIFVDAANRFAFSPDLGCDKVFIYRLDAAKGKLAPNDPAFAALKPGAGPRHFDFHPNGRFAYTINELDSTVTAFAYDAGRGSLSPIQSIGTLPEGFQGNNSTADVHVHPSGKFLYGSNRGHNSIAVFAVDSDTGKLRALGHESTQGKTPRNFGLDPSGTLLLAANQDSGNVVVFRIDPKSGLLKATGSSLSVGAPVCVKFMEPLK